LSNPSGEVQVKSGETTWTFRVCNNTLCRLQNDKDLGFKGEDEEFLPWLAAKLDAFAPRVYRLVAYHGLIPKHPDITLEAAGDVVTAVGAQRLAQVFIEALKWAVPESKEKEKPPGKGTAPSPGATSS